MLRPEEYLVDYTGEEGTSSVVYPLSDVYSGTVAPAYPTNTAYDGVVETGVVLQDADIGVDCSDRLAPDFAGVGAVTLPHAALIAGGAFDILHGGTFHIGRATPSAVSGGVKRRVVQYKQTPTNDLLDIQIDGDSLWYRFNAQGVLYNSALYGLADGIDITETFSVALTWDWTAHEVVFIINGVPRETYAYSTLWSTYNGGPAPFTMQSMMIGAHRSNTGVFSLQWDSHLAYSALFAGAAPSVARVTATHAALVG